MTVYFEDCAEIVLAGTYFGKGINHVLGAWKPGGYVLTDLQDLANAIDVEVGDTYLDWVNEDVNYDSTTVRGLTSPTDIVATSVVTAGLGHRSGVNLPANASLCMTLRSGFTGRSARGRFYAWPTVSADQTDAQNYAGAYRDGVLGFLFAVQSDCTTLGWVLSILSRRTMNADRAVGTHYAVNDIQSRNLKVDSRRSRLLSGH